MNTRAAFSTGFGCLLLFAGASVALPGCSDTAPFPEADGPGLGAHPAPTGLARGSSVVGEYVLQVNPREHTSKLSRLKPGVASQPGFDPQSVDNISVEQDGVAGSGTVNNVELVTNTVLYGSDCPSHLVASFCGNVTLRSFYTRPLNNVFVQVTSITDSTGKALTGHSAFNSDGAPTGWSSAIDGSLGLWKYTATTATTAGVIGMAPNNAGVRDWEFADPDGQVTTIVLRVISSLSYVDYAGLTVSPLTFVNGCSGGTNDGRVTTADTSITIPFPFSFYNIAASTSLKVNRDGVMAFNGTAPPNGLNTPFKNTSLPENPVVLTTSPGLYVFWDQLNFNGTTAATSSFCHKTVGTAPNRRFVVTWNNMKGMNDATDTTNLTFSAVLSEGSDTIDLLYGNMLAGTGNDANVYPAAPKVTYAQRAAGKKAIVGVEGASIATPFPATRGGTSTASGKAYRLTPIP